MSLHYTPGKVYQDGDALSAADLNTDKTSIDTAFTSLEATIESPAEANFNSQFRDNDIINGRFQVWNEGYLAAHAGTQDPADGAALAEMWYMDRSYSGGTVEVVRHDIASPNFDYAMRMNSLTQAASGTNDYVAMTYRMEGQHLGDYQAKTGTLVFSALASPAGTFSVVFTNGTDRWYVQEYTLLDNIWTDVFIPFPFFGGAGGTWNYDESTGLYVHFTFSCGTGVQTSSPGVWLTSARWGTNNQTDQANQSSGRLLLQNVWLMPNVATASASFEPPRDARKVTETQALTQRYYEKSLALDVPIGTSGSSALEGAHRFVQTDISSTDVLGSIRFRTEKRIIPTVTMYSPDSGASGKVFWEFPGFADANAVVSGEGTTGCSFTSNNTGTTSAQFSYCEANYTVDARLT